MNRIKSGEVELGRSYWAKFDGRWICGTVESNSEMVEFEHCIIDGVEVVGPISEPDGDCSE